MTEHSSSMHRLETTATYRDIYVDVQRYIQQHYAASITLTDYIQATGKPSRSVQRALAWHDTNWRRMLLDVRMTRAKEMLRNSNDPINVVADRVGYEANLFSRTFKAEEGVTPEEFRSTFRQA